MIYSICKQYAEKTYFELQFKDPDQPFQFPIILNVEVHRSFLSLVDGTDDDLIKLQGFTKLRVPPLTILWLVNLSKSVEYNSPKQGGPHS